MTKHSTTGNRENPTDNLALELRLQLCASVRVGGFLSAAWRDCLTWSEPLTHLHIRSPMMSLWGHQW